MKYKVYRKAIIKQKPFFKLLKANEGVTVTPEEPTNIHKLSTATTNCWDRAHKQPAIDNKLVLATDTSYFAAGWDIH